MNFCQFTNPDRLSIVEGQGYSVPWPCESVFIFWNHPVNLMKIVVNGVHSMLHVQNHDPDFDFDFKYPSPESQSTSPKLY